MSGSRILTLRKKKDYYKAKREVDKTITNYRRRRRSGYSNA